MNARPARRPARPGRLEQQLRAELLRLPYRAFAQMACDLLAAMGYRSVLTSGSMRRGRTRLGGRDLEATAVLGVTEAKVIAQLKQYRRPVSRRFVDELRGAMLRLAAGQGVILTTGLFSRAAQRAAQEEHLAPVRLVHGGELIALLATHGIGVRRTHGRPRLDRAYFARLRSRYEAGDPAASSGRPGLPWLAARLPLLPPPDPIPNPHISTKGGGMRWHTHALIGISSLWLLEVIPHAVQPENVALLAGLATFGALLPDMDAAESKIRSFSLGGIRPFVPFANAAHSTWGHRGLLHAPVILLPLAAILTPLAFGWSAVGMAALWLGYASHLLADAGTKSGLPRWPGKGRLFLLPPGWRIRTGSQAEDALLPLLAFAVVVLMLKHLPFIG